MRLMSGAREGWVDKGGFQLRTAHEKHALIMRLIGLVKGFHGAGRRYGLPAPYLMRVPDGHVVGRGVLRVSSQR